MKTIEWYDARPHERSINARLLGLRTYNGATSIEIHFRRRHWVGPWYPARVSLHKTGGVIKWWRGRDVPDLFNLREVVDELLEEWLLHRHAGSL